MKWIPLIMKCTILLWLVCFISLILACMREYHLNITWIFINLSTLGVACFSWSTHLTSSTKHLACQSHSWAARPSPERSDLSKNHSWHSLEMNLVDWSNNGLVMMSNFGVCSKSFSFYLRLVLILNLSTKSVPKILLNQMALYPILVMLLDYFKTKPRFLNHL